MAHSAQKIRFALICHLFVSYSRFQLCLIFQLCFLLRVYAASGKDDGTHSSFFVFFVYNQLVVEPISVSVLVFIFYIFNRLKSLTQCFWIQKSAIIRAEFLIDVSDNILTELRIKRSVFCDIAQIRRIFQKLVVICFEIDQCRKTVDMADSLYGFILPIDLAGAFCSCFGMEEADYEYNHHIDRKRKQHDGATGRIYCTRRIESINIIIPAFDDTTVKDVSARNNLCKLISGFPLLQSRKLRDLIRSGIYAIEICCNYSAAFGYAKCSVKSRFVSRQKISDRRIMKLQLLVCLPCRAEDDTLFIRSCNGGNIISSSFVSDSRRINFLRMFQNALYGRASHLFYPIFIAFPRRTVSSGGF